MPPRLKLGTEPYPYLPKRMCECASPKVLRASRRSGVLIIPKSAPLLNLEGWLIDATGYAPGLPSPMRPISVVAKKILPCGSLKNTMTTALYAWGMDMWCTAAGTVKWRYLWALELSPIGSM